MFKKYKKYKSFNKLYLNAGTFLGEGTFSCVIDINEEIENDTNFHTFFNEIIDFYLMISIFLN